MYAILQWLLADAGNCNIIIIIIMDCIRLISILPQVVIAKSERNALTIARTTPSAEERKEMDKRKECLQKILDRARHE
jgi:hypothetical protein